MLASPPGNPAAVCECPGTLNDSPSDVKWFADGVSSFPLLAASSWDGNITVWEIQTNKPLMQGPTTGVSPATGLSDPAPTALNPVGKNQVNVGSPALCCAFANAQTVIVGTLDKRVVMVKLATNEVVQIGQHDAWIRRVFFDDKTQSVISVSYDGTIKWWNGGAGGPNATPAHTVRFNGKIVDADATKELLAIITETSELSVYSLANPSSPKTISIAPFSYPIASLRIFSNGQGACIGSVEGRSRIIGFMNRSSDEFTFRCQRVDASGEPIPSTSVPPEKHYAYSVNAVDFNPIYDSLITAGGDGHVTTWDKDSRVKLQAGPKMPGPITCIKFDASGRLLAVGTGYDWSLGIAGKQQKIVPNKIVVMSVPDTWIKRKKT